MSSRIEPSTTSRRAPSAPRHPFLALLVAGFPLVGAPAVHAFPEEPPIRTSVWTTLRSTIDVPELGEAVRVEGRLHVMSELANRDQVDVGADVAETWATGLSTGRTFEVTGTDRATLDVPFDRAPVTWQPGFALTPDGPPIRLAL